MQIHIVAAIVQGLLLGLFLAISVGPTLFAVIKYSLTSSYKAGMAFVLGVSFSDISYVVIANIAAVWLVYLEEYKKMISYGGAAALCIVGLVGLLNNKKSQSPAKEPTVITGGHYFKIWLSGFLINTLNPGVFITWLGAVTAIADKTVLYRIIFFACCLGLVLSIDFLKVFLADRIRRQLNAHRVVILQKISSLCILGIGLALAFTTYFNIGTKKSVDKQSLYQHSPVKDQNILKG